VAAAGCAVPGHAGVNYALSQQALGPAERVRIRYQPTFLEQIRSGNVRSISSQDEMVQGELERAIRYPPDEQDAPRSTYFDTHVPAFADTRELAGLLREHDVTVDARAPDTGPPLWETLLFGLGPTILLFALLFWLFRRAAQRTGGLGGMGGLGRAEVTRADPAELRVTFDDVAGIDEVKEELVEIVDFLREPQRFQRLGARMPHGVLLSGPPGTSKTLLARAMAGEAGVPFFTMSASEFIEMIVGASRVRDLFRQAKEAAPAIIFIDELDAIGRRRGATSSPAAARARADAQPDPHRNGRLRPAQRDRRAGRHEPTAPMSSTRRCCARAASIVACWSRRRTRTGAARSSPATPARCPLAADVDLDALAASTPGMVGADLANLANEAALTAARRGREQVAMRDFTDALERIVLGAERKILMTSEDRRRTAYHEAGHAIVGMLIPDADPVRKLSIIPRGQALGVTFSAPDVDRLSYDQQDLLARIRVALGGRVAEEIVFGTHTTGAEYDLQQITDVARRMVGRWGMSDAVGPMVALPADTETPVLPGGAESPPDTQRLVDREVRRILADAHGDVTTLLTEHREKLDTLAHALLEHETLDGPAA
jgi:cell division protease FtsH